MVGYWCRCSKTKALIRLSSGSRALRLTQMKKSGWECVWRGSWGAKVSASYWFEVLAPSIELGISLWVSQGVPFTTNLQNSTLAFIFLLHLWGPSLTYMGPGKEWGALVLADRTLRCSGGPALGSAGERERLGPPQARGLPPLCGVMTPPPWDQSPSKRPSFSERWQPETVDVAECLRPLPSVALRDVMVLFFVLKKIFFFLLLVSIYAYHVLYSANLLVLGYVVCTLITRSLSLEAPDAQERQDIDSCIPADQRALRWSFHGTAQSCPQNYAAGKSLKSHVERMVLA